MSRWSADTPAAGRMIPTRREACTLLGAGLPIALLGAALLPLTCSADEGDREGGGTQITASTEEQAKTQEGFLMQENTDRLEAVYLGIEGYGTVDAADKEDFIHRFAVNGDTLCYRVRSDEHFSLQNALMEGYIYDISVADDTVCAVELLDRDCDNVAVGTVTALDGETVTVQKEGQHAGRSIMNSVTLALSDTTAVYSITAAAGGAAVERCAPTAESLAVGDTVKVIIGSAADETEPSDASGQNDEASILHAENIYKTFVAEAYEPAVTGTPGTLTLDNFLALALEPVGTALYIYGGAWDWQDKYSSNQAMTVGIPQTWIDFFQAQDDTFSYINREDPAHSYYPHNAWNQYYYAGADCSGYVGWVLYNLVNTEDSDVAHSNGFVEAASEIAKSLSDKGWGSWRADTADGFGPGDIVSLSGHVWISLGTCSDGSVVLLHATPSASHSGAEGGGIQISALDPAGSTDCEAYRLADYYMRLYFPDWYERYDAILRDYSVYTTFTPDSNEGIFKWDLSGNAFISDPLGFADREPGAILAELFCE